MSRPCIGGFGLDSADGNSAFDPFPDFPKLTPGQQQGRIGSRAVQRRRIRARIMTIIAMGAWALNMKETLPGPEMAPPPLERSHLGGATLKRANRHTTG